MLKDKLILTNIILSLLAIQITLWLIFLNLGRLPPVIPLFYLFNTPSQILAPLNYYWLLPSVAGISFALNLLLARLLYRKSATLAHMLLGTAALISVLLLLATLQILRAVLY